MLQYRFVYDNFREKGKTKMNLTKQFFKYVSQNIFGLLGTSCYILADTYFISQAAGTDGVTLLNLCLPIYNFIFAIGSMIGLGAATRYAILRAQGEERAAQRYFSNAVFCACLLAVPFVLVGSIRDDGPLPEVYANVYEGQDAMRECIRKATTVICMATTLHSIATGNMTPSFRVMPDGTVRQVYFYSVDVSEFAVNKLGDRGSLSAKSIVTNVQDFVVNVSKGLKL